MTLQKLQGVLPFWQKLLRLQDWDITLHYIRCSKMTNKEAWAEVEVSNTYQRAHIFLRDPIDVVLMHHPEDDDPEASLVHELMHCRINIKVPDDFYTQYEEGIERTAQALLSLHRELPYLNEVGSCFEHDLTPKQGTLDEPRIFT